MRYNLLWIFVLLAFPSDFSKIFGEDYTSALSFLSENKDSFSETAASMGADLEVVAPVLFPELIRYSQFRDFFETKGLEWVYVTSGPESADFSIGRFQMKPSFIEKLELYLKSHRELDFLPEAIYTYPVATPEKIREIRLDRLKDIKWQFRYGCTFYHVLKHKFPEQMQGDNISQIRFAAAAYNHGFQGENKEILRWADKKTFPYGTNYPGKQYAYGEVAVDFYQRWYTGIFGEKEAMD